MTSYFSTVMIPWDVILGFSAIAFICIIALKILMRKMSVKDIPWKLFQYIAIVLYPLIRGLDTNLITIPQNFIPKLAQFCMQIERDNRLLIPGAQLIYFHNSKATAIYIASFVCGGLVGGALSKTKSTIQIIVEFCLLLLAFEIHIGINRLCNDAVFWDSLTVVLMCVGCLLGVTIFKTYRQMSIEKGNTKSV